jgi:hypothetical protein
MAEKREEGARDYMDPHDIESLREDMEFRLSLLRLMTVPYGRTAETDGESQLERMCSLAGLPQRAQ